MSAQQPAVIEPIGVISPSGIIEQQPVSSPHFFPRTQSIIISPAVFPPPGLHPQNLLLWYKATQHQNTH